MGLPDLHEIRSYRTSFLNLTEVQPQRHLSNTVLDSTNSADYRGQHPTMFIDNPTSKTRQVLLSWELCKTDSQSQKCISFTTDSTVQ